jgi:hypothetical protein
MTFELTYPLHIKFREFLSSSSLSHQNCQQNILDVTMAKLRSLYFGGAAYVPSTKGMS